MSIRKKQVMRLRHGPILADSPSNTNDFSWEAYAWPWEMEEM